MNQQFIIIFVVAALCIEINLLKLLLEFLGQCQELALTDLNKVAVTLFHFCQQFPEGYNGVLVKLELS